MTSFIIAVSVIVASIVFIVTILIVYKLEEKHNTLVELASVWNGCIGFINTPVSTTIVYNYDAFEELKKQIGNAENTEYVEL